MSDLLVPGSLWRDRQPSGNRSTDLQYFRRVVEVNSPGSAAMWGSRVGGISFWQELKDGVWTGIEGPGAKRYTVILRHQFLSKFEHIQGPS